MPRRPGRALFRHGLAGTAEIDREVPQLRQAVVHGQDRLGVVHMHHRVEGQVRDRRGEDIHHVQGRVAGHQVAAAEAAVLPLAHRGLGIGRHVLAALGHQYGFGRPEAEGVDRPARPGPAGTAVAVAHRIGCAGDGDLDGAAEAGAGIGCGHSVSS